LNIFPFILHQEVAVRHPFDLKLPELQSFNDQVYDRMKDVEFEEVISPDEADSVAGGRWATTLAIGEEGGRWPRPYPKPPWPPTEEPIVPPVDDPIKPIKPPIYTTHAIGEEGGSPPELIGPPDVTTLALGEEGGLSIM
jgi:hypothetical protein